MANKLYYGDNLIVLRNQAQFPDAFVDLVYLDPPFNSNADYNALFKTPKGQNSPAQMEAFTDTWQWDDATAGLAVKDVKQSPYQDAARMLDAMVGFLGKNALTAYLAMMAVRLIELHRVLKPTGSLYLHCDPTASHYLKILLDAVFGAKSFRSEITWKRSSAHSDGKQGRKQYGNISDVILFYSKSSTDWLWNAQYTEYDKSYVESAYRLTDKSGRRYRRDNLTAAKPGGDVSYLWPVKRPVGGAWEADLADAFQAPLAEWEYRQVPPYNGRYWAYSRENMRKFATEDRLAYASSGMPEYKRYLDEMPGVPLQNIWTDIYPVSGKESLGYPTQKPVSLMERILSASSNPGDTVLDPFCGCGTTVHAAQKLGRNWIGIDVTHIAIGLIEGRLRTAFPGVAFDVFGTPMDADAARDFFARNDPTKKEFEIWAAGRLGFIPQSKKGADGGVDGVRWFGVNEEYRAVVSVKGGTRLGVEMVRSLDAVVTAQGAQIGVLLTLSAPTKPMEDWARAAGLCEVPGFAPVNRLQIVSIEQALALRERAVEIPARRDDTFRKAPVEVDARAQGKLDL